MKLLLKYMYIDLKTYISSVFLFYFIIYNKITFL